MTSCCNDPPDLEWQGYREHGQIPDKREGCAHRRFSPCHSNTRGLGFAIVATIRPVIWDRQGRTPTTHADRCAKWPYAHWTPLRRIKRIGNSYSRRRYHHPHSITPPVVSRKLDWRAGTVSAQSAICPYRSQQRNGEICLTTTHEIPRSINYDAASGDYAMRLDGELIGFAHASRYPKSLDQLVFRLLSSGATATASALDGGSDADDCTAEVVGMLVEVAQTSAAHIRARLLLRCVYARVVCLPEYAALAGQP